jgi:hypothetical protein
VFAVVVVVVVLDSLCVQDESRQARRALDRSTGEKASLTEKLNALNLYLSSAEQDLKQVSFFSMTMAFFLPFGRQGLFLRRGLKCVSSVSL